MNERTLIVCNVSVTPLSGVVMAFLPIMRSEEKVFVRGIEQEKRNGGVIETKGHERIEVAGNYRRRRRIKVANQRLWAVIYY